MIGWFLPELVLFLASMLAVIFEVFFGPSSAHIDSKISENKVVLTIVIGGIIYLTLICFTGVINKENIAIVINKIKPKSKVS